MDLRRAQEISRVYIYLNTLDFELYKQQDDKWSLIASKIGSRTDSQVRSHAQKYFDKLNRYANKIGKR